MMANTAKVHPTDAPRRIRAALLLAIGAILAMGASFGAYQALAEGPATTALVTPEAHNSLPADFHPTHLQPLDVHPRTSLTIVEQLRHNHYLDKNLDDNLSSEIYDKYLDALDGAHVYFLADDVAKMDKYRYQLDDALIRGNLDPAFEMFNLYQDRLTERLEFLLSELDKGLDKFDFTADESIEIDRKNAPWPRTVAELDDIWRKRLKAAALSMMLNGKDLDEIQELLTKRYRNRLKQSSQTKSEDAFQLYVNAFASTYDPHTQYFSPRTSQNFNINMSLSLEGIGAVLRSEDEYTEVVELVPAGPADKSGSIAPADRIVSVGQGETGPMIDVVGWRLDDVVELIRGPKDSVVRLEIVPHTAEDGATRVVTITRNTVQLEEQAAQKKLLTFNRNGHEQRIGVVEIPTFYADFKAMQQGDPNYKSTTRDVRRLIDELKAENIDGLVIDLRNNGGGSLQEADALTGLFIKSGPTVQVKSANRRPSIYADTDDSVAWDGPLAVVVNRLSASASEIFAGAIQDYERGLIIGSQTFGKGTVQTLIPLNRGQLKITAAKFYRVSGHSTQHQGVLPDIQLPELFDTEQIGESALDDAMPWDMIQPAVYPHSHQIEPLLGQLRSLHESRVVGDPDFVYMRALAARNLEDSHKTELSLNEAERAKEKAADDAWRLSLENALRIAKGKEPVKDLEALEAEASADKDQDPMDDAMLRESGNILLDYIGLTRQVALVEHTPDAQTTVQ
ncbi:MAG: carboxy terminal-processing peptidase [Pseudomonadales bacterium]